jgi:hypothetical protein
MEIISSPLHLRDKRNTSNTKTYFLRLLTFVLRSQIRFYPKTPSRASRYAPTFLCTTMMNCRQKLANHQIARHKDMYILGRAPSFARPRFEHSIRSHPALSAHHGIKPATKRGWKHTLTATVVSLQPVTVMQVEHVAEVFEGGEQGDQVLQKWARLML